MVLKPEPYNAASVSSISHMDASPASGRLPVRITISIVTLAACCLLSSARLVLDAHSLQVASDEIARRSDQRFSALKAALPGQGVVGYVGEPGTPALADYYLTQYALAPLVVDHSPNHALVVGNFPASPSAGAPSGDLQLVKDFGDGVLLFATKPFIDNDDQRKDAK